MFSIICLYNDRIILDEWLCDGLSKQTVPYELKLLDNTKGQFTSAAQALNQASQNLDNKYIMFVHQDVRLGSKTWLADAERCLDGLGNFGAAGVAGSSKENRGLANVIHGVPPIQAGFKTDKPTPVQTLDGCLVMTRKDVFMKIGFDETTCKYWHLYPIDYCLDLGTKGYNVYVIPYGIYHLSKGSGAVQSEGFKKTKEQIIKKHRDHVDCIYTTTGVWETR